MTTPRSTAEQLDADDPLAGYRAGFVIDDDTLIYLDGNSLGRLTKAGRDEVTRALEHGWGQRLILSWDEGWVELPRELGDRIGTGLLGVDPGEVIVGDTTTVALYKALSAALDARPGRRAVVIERANFPTDRYVVESLARQRGLEIRWIDEEGVDGVGLADLEAVLDESVAVVLLSHVDYRSAAILDLAGLTDAAHGVGALAVWDLCHSVGALPLDLQRDAVDVAVGCTYKYLNGGPGAPSFTYVPRRLQPELAQPIWGWWGRQEMFEMAQGYLGESDMRSWLTGTPGVLSMVAIGPAVQMIADAGVPNIRAKSVALTELAIALYDDWLAPRGCELRTTRDADRRGSHITIGHPDARATAATMTADGVIPDFRQPDGIRLGLAPLTTRFVDVYDGLLHMSRILG